jgi:hypothetical protein
MCLRASMSEAGAAAPAVHGSQAKLDDVSLVDWGPPFNGNLPHCDKLLFWNLTI